jgi:hypothetical protein
MNCRRARNLLFDFIDGLSNEASRAEVERHLGECADCERFAAEMTRSLAVLRHVPVEPLDENFNWKVKLAIHRERNAALSRAQSAGAWVKGWNVRYAVSGGLAFGAVLVVGAVLLSDGGPVPAPSRATDSRMQVTQETTGGSASTVDTSRPVPRPANRIDPVNNDGRLVSTGRMGDNRSSTPVSGAIDMTEAEARLDSLIKSDVSRMSPREAQEYFERLNARLRQHSQSQQAPAQR